MPSRRPRPGRMDGAGRGLRVGDRVAVNLSWCRGDGWPPRGVITGWDGWGVAEVRAPRRRWICHPSGHRWHVNYEPAGLYSIPTQLLTRL